MATLKIIRQSEYANRFRNIEIFLDNKELCRISNAETQAFKIAEGVHTLHAKIDWCTSNKISFSVSQNQSIAFQITSFAKHNPLGVFAAIYYITFGANRYLKLEEESI